MEEAPPHDFKKLISEQMPVTPITPLSEIKKSVPSTPSLEAKKADEGPYEVELRFVFDEKQTDIVTRVSNFRQQTVHQLAHYVRDLFNIPDQTIYFFQQDLRLHPQQRPLPRNTLINTLESSTGMLVAGPHNIRHYYVYWTHLAEDAGNWVLKRDRLLSIFGIALFQLNADLRASTFQIFETLKTLPLDVPLPVLDSNFITPMKESIEEEEAAREPILRSYFSKLIEPASRWDNEQIIAELEHEYVNHPSNALWLRVRDFLRAHYTKLVQSIETLRETIRSLNENAAFIDNTLRQHRFEAPIDPRHLPAGGQTNLNVYPTSLAPDGTIQVITNVTQSIDFALVSNLYDIQRQSFMFDAYKCEADSIWGLVNQLETRKRLWIVRDQLRALIKILMMWEGSIPIPAPPEPIRWSGIQQFHNIQEVAAQGAASTCVTHYTKTLVFS